MKIKYKILYLEAVPADAELVNAELQKSNFDFDIRVIENEAEFKKQLVEYTPDLVLSDFAVPQFNSFEALKFLKKSNIKIPLIAIADKMTEDFVIAINKEGATDYIIKDRLMRLPFAIINAIHKYHFEEDCLQLINEVQTKEEIMKNSLKESEVKLSAALNELRKIMDSSLDIICTINAANIFISVSKASTFILGYSPEELIGKNFKDFVYEEDIDKSLQEAKNIKDKISVSSFENRYKHKNGALISFLWSAKWDDQDQVMYCIAKNISENKKFKKSLESERQHLCDIFLQAPTSMGILKGPTHIFESANQPYLKLIAKKDIVGKTVAEVLPEVIEQGFIKLLDTVYKTGETFRANEMLIKFDLHGTGELKESYLNFIYQAFKNTNDEIEGIFFFAIDVTEQVLSRKKIEESENRFREIFNSIPEALVIIDSINWKFLNFNETAISKLKITEETFLKKGPLDISPAVQKEGKLSKEKANKYFSEALKGKKPTFEWTFLDVNNKEICCEVRLSIICYNNKNEILASITDISERKKNEQQMKELTDRLLLATRAAGMGIWDWNIKKNHLNWDDRMYQLYDIDQTKKDAKYTEWHLRIHPEEKARVDEELKNVVAGKKEYEIDFRIIRRDKTINYIRATGITQKNNEGNVVRMIGLNWDITKQKERDLQLNLMESVITNTTDSVIITEAKPFDEKSNGIIYVNEAFTKMTGYAAEEAIGKSPNFLQGPKSDKLELLKLDKAVKNLETFETTMVNYKKNGEEFWINFSVSPVANENGKVTHWISIERDVTERKLSELRLLELNNNLKNQTKELALSNAELEQFAYVASHDLQEPLRMISSFLTLLEKKYGNIIDEKGKKYISFAVDGAKRMRQIILDLLDFSRAGNTIEDIEDLNLNELINEIKILLRKNIEEKEAVLFADKLPQIHAHRSPMRQIFQNLIANALLYSNKNIPVQIIITSKNLNTHWQFAVSDNGIGIEKEYFDKIFIIFQRLHGKEEYSGTGMGLAITKKIIETQGGKIWVESEPGKGSTFYFTIKK